MEFDQITKIGEGYWEKRALKLELLTQEKASDTVNVVCRNYNRAQRNIVDRIEQIFSRYVSHNEALNAEKALRLLSEKQTAEPWQKLLELYNSTEDPGLPGGNPCQAGGARLCQPDQRPPGASGPHLHRLPDAGAGRGRTGAGPADGCAGAVLLPADL